MNWRIWYLVCGTLFLPLFLALCCTKIELKKSDERLQLSEAKNLVRDPKFLLIISCMFLYTGSEIGAWGWMSTFLKNNLRFTILQGSLAVAFFWVAMTVGRFLAGQATLKYANSSLIILLSFLSSVIILLSIFFTNIPMMWLSTFLMGLAFSSIWPLVLSYGGEHRRSSSGTLFSILVGAGGVGATVIPWAMGMIADRCGSRFPMFLPFFALLLVGLIFVFFKRRDSSS